MLVEMEASSSNAVSKRHGSYRALAPFAKRSRNSHTRNFRERKLLMRLKKYRILRNGTYVHAFLKSMFSPIISSDFGETKET